MSSLRRIAIATIVLVLSAHVAAAQAPTEAERLYTEGQTAYDAKRYDEAVKAWERSYELSRLPALVFNIAQAYRLRGSCTKAVETYRKFIALDPKSGERPTAEGLIKEMEPCADRPAPEVVPKVVVPVVDDSKRDVVTRDQGRGKRIGGVVFAITGLALVGTGAYFGKCAQTLADEVRTACVEQCEWAELEAKDADGRQAAKLQYVFYGAGAAAAVTGGVMYWLGARSRATPVIAPRGDGGAMVLWRGSW